MISRFSCFFALFFGLGFASPLLVMLSNHDDIAFSPLWFSLVAITFVLLLSAGAYYFSGKTRFASTISIISLSCAFVFALQGNVVHDLFYYGEFNGSRIDWRQYGWKFWLEWGGFLLAFPLFYSLLNRLRQIPVWLALIPVMSSVLLLAPVLISQPETSVTGLADDDVDQSVLEFSSELNLVHLLPDGFQGDIAGEVLQDHPELAARLDGFTLYRDHLGMYQGTAPSVPAIFTGRPFDFAAGYESQRAKAEIQQYAYPARLLENNFRLDYVTIMPLYCVNGATSCIKRSFNDLKPRGYFRYKNDQRSYAFRQLADLTLFRHLPMFLKERIYNDGNWFFADTTLDGSSPWPDPVLREWIDNMVIAGPQPRYKWYHYIGAHIPPHWDADCVFNRDLERTRKQYYDQSLCILTGIARFADKLRLLGIYEQTAIIVSGDHGVNIEPDDMRGVKTNGSLYAGVLGAARPALLLKPLNNREPFAVSALATTLLDIAPTALDLVGLEGGFTGHSVLKIDPEEKRTRIFNPYTVPDFWTGKPISNDIWHVDGPVMEMENWSLQNIVYQEAAPASYPVINYSTAFATSRGLSLNRSQPNEASSWITGTELMILVATEYPERPAQINLELRLPDFMQAEKQSFTVSVNHQLLDEVYSLQASETWLQLTIPIADGLLIKGNNLLTLRFKETASAEGNDNWRVAGEIKSFHLLQ